MHRGLFDLIGQWSDAPPSGASPFDWGRPSWLRDVVGARFEIELCEQITTLYAPDEATVWTEYVNGFGPVAATYASLPQDRKKAVKAAFENFHRPYATAMGLMIPRQDLIVHGIRS